MKRCRKLIFVFGDHLSHRISSLNGADPQRDVVLMCEVVEEATYVRHHKKKIVLIFSAMRHFADELRIRGFSVRYVRLDDADNSGSFTGELSRAVDLLSPDCVVVTEPGEWRVREDVLSWQSMFGVPVDVLPDARFLCSHEEFTAWADGRRTLTMEFFYRHMRRKTKLLLQGDDPVGGRWNFDSENRAPVKPDLFRSARLQFKPDTTTREVIDLVERRFTGHMGTAENFNFAVTCSGAQDAADVFIRDFLPFFGDTQDAMLRDDAVLNHSVLSPYLNLGLLDPLELCKAAERAYLEGRAPLNAVEGFIRQIIGWREYVRGMYWRFMPEYAHRNVFKAARPLPDFFWTGKTDMACLATTINDTIDNAYAHHIQRLMVTGNFAMLAGLDPFAVHEWYLEVYADAFEWVELPNVIGMSQFADGGLLGSKPYCASGSYICRMSDYCEGCKYDVRKKTGTSACPFNSLFWDFLDRHAERLSNNRRLHQSYATWKRMTEERRNEYRQSARAFLQRLDESLGV